MTSIFLQTLELAKFKLPKPFTHFFTQSDQEKNRLGLQDTVVCVLSVAER